MEKKSGVGENTTSLPGGGGGVRSIGDSFQPNLAMGGGSYKVPIELPLGPGGFSPKIDLVYNTGFGNGPLGIGWTMSVPYIERSRQSPYLPPDEVQYSLSGAESLVPVGDGKFVPFIQPTLQKFNFDGQRWSCTAPNLISMSYGSSPASRIAGLVDRSNRVCRWLLDRVTFPGDRHVEFDYEAIGAQRLLRRIRWSVFRLECEYEARPDPFSQFDTGFELRQTQRLIRLDVHHDRLTPATHMRSYELEYTSTGGAETSLLHRIRTTGFRHEEGGLQSTSLPPLTFNYTTFSPDTRHIIKFKSNTVPPPSLDDDTTIIDFLGSSLPGVLRMNGTEATYWENRGNARWGPPQRLAQLPQGLRLGADRVRFADLTGNGTADLLVTQASGGGYFPHDPEQGFQPKRSTMLAPSFDLSEEGSHLLDLNGDRVVDLLTFRNGTPIAFFNQAGEAWTGPVALPDEHLPNFNQTQPRLRFADMNGDGSPDMVQLHSRQVTYYPSLGNGRWGPARVMSNTPEFNVPRPDEDVYLADLNGDGAADLILVGNGVIRIYLNNGGERFGEAIVLDRTPRFGTERFVLTDMAGSGTAGFLWNVESSAASPHEYWYLDPLNGVKPYLLQTIDNGMGLTTRIEYSTSSFERTLDLDSGYRWSGYLPFSVHVVKRLTQIDTVVQTETTTQYSYHDGHYDGRAREFLGFARVDSLKLATSNEAAVSQVYSFHTRGASARDPAFIAGKGQPHRTEVIDPGSGEIRQVDEAHWVAVSVATLSEDRPAYLALERSRSSSRMQAGVEYEREHIDFEHDGIGNITREHRRGEWTDSTGSPRVDELVIDTSYASHPVIGATTISSRVVKTDGAGRLLKHMSFFYDGPAHQGLPLGTVEHGFMTRQTEIALTAAEIGAAYGGVAPALLSDLYREELDPDWGNVFVKDTRRYRVDAVGNQLETLDALGLQVTLEYDADGIHPVSISEEGGTPRVMTYDPIAQQLNNMEDMNGNAVRTHYDGLGNVIAVFKRGANPDRPTETYEYQWDTLPCRKVQRVRVLPGDLEPGWQKVEYLDGSGRVYQDKTLAENGRWAVGQQRVLSIAGRSLLERAAHFTDSSDFDGVPPAGLPERSLHYDFAGRLLEERLFNGGLALYHYDRNATAFFAPDRSAAWLADPSIVPTRRSRANAWGKIVSIEEFDADGSYEQQRDYDALGQLVRVLDPTGVTSLQSVFDLWGTRISVRSAEAGLTTFVYNASNNETLRTDADGRVLYTKRDLRGRVTEIRRDGPVGPLEETYTYDAGPGNNLDGRLARVEGSFGTAEYSYTVDGDPARIRRTFSGNPTTYEIGFEYDHQRQVRLVEYPDSTRVEYLYYPNGKLRSIPGYIDSIEYGASGRRVRIVFANGLETLKTLSAGDDLLQEIVTRNMGDGVTYQHLVHHLDLLGQVTQIEDQSTVIGKRRNNQTFEYDGRNRLVRATGRGAESDYEFEYRYDRNSNLVFSGESFAEEMDYGHHLGDMSHPNRLIKRRAAPSAEYEYDASGNLTRDPAVGVMTYDARHRLVRVDRPNGAVVEYLYDHNGRRSEARVTTQGTTTIRYEVENLYLVEDGVITKIVFDDNRRLAIVPQMGDALLHHLDRLGNVNVVSNLATGAFVGHDEYTPYGRLSISILIMPHFSFQGGHFSDGLDMVLLGARHYRPMLGRFITPDAYLLVKQDRIIGIVAAAHLYLYALANPANFTDPTGQIAFLAVLLIAVAIGAVLGLIGAAVNGADTWDEWVLWIVGGAIGGALVALAGGGIALLFSCAAVKGAIIAVVIWSIGSLVGTILTPILDDTDSKTAWFFSFILKWIQSPVTSTIGLIAALIVWAGGGDIDLRRGVLFIEVGPGNGALTLGAVAWTQEGRFMGGRVSDDLARHESFHSRTVTALGELGFYFTYVTVGAIWSKLEGGSWNDLNGKGCGNPFEKTAHTFTGDPAVAVATHNC